ncbi:MAG: hypothetical protein KKA67_13115 [Spirochaetes bacterium]|nr:hypothetical protein [Spirochaetota bacterium]MBU1081347.1 hypothetical protein [Spirochaetota bacterium]
MRRIARITAAIIAVSSCSTAPEPLPQEPVISTEPVEAVPEEKPAEAVEPATVPETVPFDPSTVSVELKQATFFDVRALIQGLNSIIQAKDYEAWSSALTGDYKAYYSSTETLAKISEAPVLKRQGIALRTLQDYFIHVVYPSRQNDRVDDIEFIDANRIRAITINAKGERLVLYNLEKIGDTWKIATWR